jgi:hypothetical protein
MIEYEGKNISREMLIRRPWSMGRRRCKGTSRNNATLGTWFHNVFSSVNDHFNHTNVMPSPFARVPNKYSLINHDSILLHAHPSPHKRINHNQTS